MGDLTPTMTSNTTPSPYVASASNALGGFPAWQAFDGSGATRWVTQAAAPQNLELDFGGIVGLGSYTINNNLNGNAPKNWTFEYSADGTNWTVADTQTNQNPTAASPGNTYTFTPQQGRYWRLNVSAYNNAGQLDIWEFRFIGATISGVGSANGSATSTAKSLANKISPASAAGVAAVAGAGIALVRRTGNSTGTATAQAISAASKSALAASSGVSTVAGLSNALKSSNAASAGISVVAANSNALKSSTALSAGLSTATAFSIDLVTGVGHAAGVSSVIGQGSSLAQSIALAAGNSIASAVGIGFVNPLNTVLMPSKASGPYFTRKRFEKLLEEQEQKRLAELRRLEAKKQKQLDEAIAQRKELIAKRVAELLRNSGATPSEFTGPAAISFGPDYTVHARHAQDMANDEDEAIALLLLS